MQHEPCKTYMNNDTLPAMNGPDLSEVGSQEQTDLSINSVEFLHGGKKVMDGSDLSEVGSEEGFDKLVLFLQALLAGESYQPVAVEGVASLTVHGVFQPLLCKGFLHMQSCSTSQAAAQPRPR